MKHKWSYTDITPEEEQREVEKVIKSMKRQELFWKIFIPVLEVVLTLASCFLGAYLAALCIPYLDRLFL